VASQWSLWEDRDGVRGERGGSVSLRGKPVVRGRMKERRKSKGCMGWGWDLGGWYHVGTGGLAEMRSRGQSFATR